MGNKCCAITDNNVNDLEISNNLEILKKMESSNTKNTDQSISEEYQNFEIKKDTLNEIIFKKPSESLQDILMSKKYDETEDSNIF